MNIKYKIALLLLAFCCVSLANSAIPFGFAPLGQGVPSLLQSLLINGVSPTATYTVSDLKTPPTLIVSQPKELYPMVAKFTWDGVTWETSLTNTAGSYSATMPVIPAGPVRYSVVADNGASLPASGTFTYINSESLPNLRQPNLSLWSSQALAPMDNDWYGSKVVVEPFSVFSLAGYATAQSALADPWIRTRSMVTVGSIWFKAKFTNEEGAGTILVEKSTGTISSAHTIVETLTVPYSSNWIQYRIDLNTTSAAYYRIRHPSGIDGDRVIFKDIVISAPAADVVISKNEVDYNPGYPSRHDPVTFKVSVTNVLAGAPASNISPKLVWRLNEGAWTQTPMPSIGADQYQVTLPEMNPGDFEYYYRADFTGYAYTGLFYVTSGASADNESAFSYMLDSSKYTHECRSPATLPNFPNSQYYDLRAEPYPTNRYGASAYTNGFNYYGFTIPE